MPAKSKVQQELMGADLARLRRGEATRTGMTESQLEHFAGTPRGGLPNRIPSRARVAALKKKAGA